MEILDHIKKYDYFRLIKTDEKFGNKNIYQLVKESGDVLGFLFWYTRWNEWVMESKNGVIWSDGCLDDVQDAIKQIKKEENQ